MSVQAPKGRRRWVSIRVVADGDHCDLGVGSSKPVTLDGFGPFPVTLTVVALNGAGVVTDDENAVSVVLRMTYGSFDEVLGGDLTGDSPDIESIVAPLVGDVDVYKVNHHGSQYSTNDIAWPGDRV